MSNTYAAFTELAHSLLNPDGISSLVVPLGLVTDHGTKELFSYLAENGFLRSVYGFENEEFIFPTVHHAFKFCVLCCTKTADLQSEICFAFFARSKTDLDDKRRHFNLLSTDILSLNPNTKTCPIFRSNRDFQITGKVYKEFPIIDHDFNQNLWNVSIHRILHSTDDSSLMIHLDDDERRSPRAKVDDHCVDAVYEGKMFHQFDHRFGTYIGQTPAQQRQGKLPEFTSLQHLDAALYSQPRYWIDTLESEKRLQPHLGNQQWLFAFRDITSPVVLRTAIGTILPRVSTVDLRCIFFPSCINVTDVACFLVVLGRSMHTTGPMVS
jgi:hypothetical protein